MIEVVCPYCNTPKIITNSVVCDSCGWIYLFFIDEFPEHLKSYLKDKLALLTSIQENLVSKKSISKELEATKNNLNISVEENTKTLDTLNLELKEKAKLKVALESDLIFLFDKTKLNESKEILQKNIIKSRHLLSRQKYNDLNVAEILCSIEKDCIEINLPRSITKTPDLMIGFSSQHELFLIENAEVVYKIDSVSYYDSIPLRIPFPQVLTHFPFRTVSLFSHNDLNRVRIKIINHGKI